MVLLVDYQIVLELAKMPGVRQRRNQMALNLSPCHVAKRSRRIEFGLLAVANGSFSSEYIDASVISPNRRTKSFS